MLVFCKSNSFRVEGFRVVPQTGIVVENHLCQKVITCQVHTVLMVDKDLA